MEMILNSIDFDENRTMSGYSSGGEIYLSVGEQYFPAEQWYDCAWIDLKNWIPRLISFGYNHSDSCEFPFMDGPYTLRLQRRADGIISADCIREEKILESEQDLDLRALLKSVLSCCRKYDRFLFENGKKISFRRKSKLYDNYWILKTQEKYHV